MRTLHFSVIVPVYNACATLCTAVKSVQAQTEQDWEMILLDDGSTDRSLQLMLSYLCEDMRIRTVTQDNSGVSATRNLGAEFARGKYLAFLDADDAWHPDKLARHRQFHEENPDLAGSFARVAFCETRKEGLSSPRSFSTVPEGTLSLAQVLGENPVCTASNLVIERKIFNECGGFDQTMRYAEDQELLARLTSDRKQIMGIQETLTHYRMSENGLSTHSESMLEGWKKIIARYSGEVDPDAALATYYRYLARRTLRSGGSARQALEYVRQGLSIDTGSFLDNPRRGALTAAGALAGLFLPTLWRKRLFA
ncbi:MAG: glycosyltransferase family 2 protein [Sphingomonadaceae bacterium]